MKLIKSILILVLVWVMCLIGAVVPAMASPPTPVGTVSINQPGPYAFGQTVTFTITTSNVRGNAWPMIYLTCFDATSSLLYGELAHPEDEFMLGGAWSPWWDRSGVGALCSAQLYAYSKQGVITRLAETPTFFASGPSLTLTAVASATPSASGTIDVESAGPFAQGQTVDVTVTFSGMRGKTLALVQLDCQDFESGTVGGWRAPVGQITFGVTFGAPGATATGTCRFVLEVQNQPGGAADATLDMTESFEVLP